VRSLVAVLLLLACRLGPAEAALPPPPFTLEVTPTRVAAGQPVMLQITPRGGTGEFDVYLMWALVPEAAFLTPQGAWSAQPVAFRARLPATGPPVQLRWMPGPAPDIPLALVVVAPGEDPLARFAWAFRPMLTHVSAPAATPAAPLELGALAPLALATAMSCGIVLLAGRAFLA
jgi:hypothetical protein